MSVCCDKSLHFLGMKQFKPSIVVIGAMDGISFDGLAGFIRHYQWSGLFVEPIEYQFNKLKKYYGSLEYVPDNKYENSAIADFNGEVEMLLIDMAAVERGEVHPCFGGMSTIYPPRNGLASEGDAEVVSRFGRKIKVPCLTLNALLRKHNINHVDVMQLDTEGHDWKIIRQLDLSLYRPKLIRTEYINLTDQEKSEIIQHFTAHGYLYEVYGQDVNFVEKHFWAAALNFQ